MTTTVGRGLATFGWMYNNNVPFPADGNRRVLDYVRSHTKADFVGYVKDVFTEFSTETNSYTFRLFCATQFKLAFYSKDRVKCSHMQQKWRDLPEDVKSIVRRRLAEMAAAGSPQPVVRRNVGMMIGVVAAVDFPSNTFFGYPTATAFIDAIPAGNVLDVLTEVFEFVKDYNWITDDFVVKALGIAVNGFAASQASAASAKWLGLVKSLAQFAGQGPTLEILDFLFRLDRGRQDADTLKEIFAICAVAADQDGLPANAIDAIITAATTTAHAITSALDNEDNRGVLQAIFDLFGTLADRDNGPPGGPFCARFLRDIYRAYEAVGCAAFALINGNGNDDNNDDDDLLGAISASLSDVMRSVVGKYPEAARCDGTPGKCAGGGCCVVCNVLRPLLGHVKGLAGSGPREACVALETLRVLAENNIPHYNITLVQETQLDSTLFTIAQEAPYIRGLYLRFFAAMDANYYYLSLIQQQQQQQQQQQPGQAGKLEVFFDAFLSWLRDRPAAVLEPFCDCACGIASGFAQLMDAGTPIPAFVTQFLNNTFETIRASLFGAPLPSLEAYKACSSLVVALLYDYFTSLTHVNDFYTSLSTLLKDAAARRPQVLGTVPTEAVMPYLVDIMNEYVPHFQTLPGAIECLNTYLGLCAAKWFSQSVARGIAAFRHVLGASAAADPAVPSAVRSIVEHLIPYIQVNVKVECSSALDVISAYVSTGAYNNVLAPAVPKLVKLLRTKIIPFSWHLVKPAAVNLLAALVCSPGSEAFPQSAMTEAYNELIKCLNELAKISVEDKNDDNDVDYVQDARITVLESLAKLFARLKTAGIQDCTPVVSIALDAITCYYNDWDYTTDKAFVLLYDLCTTIFKDFAASFSSVISTERELLQNLNTVIRGFNTRNTDIINARANAVGAYTSL